MTDESHPEWQACRERTPAEHVGVKLSQLDRAFRDSGLIRTRDQILQHILTKIDITLFFPQR